LLDFIFGWFGGVCKLHFAVRCKGQPASKLVTVITEHTEEARNAFIQVVVDFHQCRWLVEQN
jgi:hypothetical protein